MMVTQDLLNELIQLVRNLLTTVNTLELSVAELSTRTLKIDNLSKLLDVSITDITIGDILHFSNDGKWHNIQPNKIIVSSGSGPSIYRLADLEDVEISSPTTGLSIIYNTYDGKWHNGSVGGGGGIEPGILDNYLTKVEAEKTYFPITGGTINGDVQIKGNLLTTGGITIHSTVL